MGIPQSSQKNRWLLPIGIPLSLAVILLAGLLWVFDSVPMARALASSEGAPTTLANGSQTTIGAAADMSSPAEWTGWRQVDAVQLESDQINAAGVNILVSTIQDELNQDGDCSLREAIQAANTDSAVDACPAGSNVITDTITFSASGTYTLSNQLDVIAGGPLVIDGGEAITISGEHSARIFSIDNGADLTLENLTVTDGKADNGGGIFNSGLLTMKHSTLSNGQADIGGGIYNSGFLTMRDSALSSSSAWGYYTGAGGGIYNTGALTITSSALSSNHSFYHAGGGIYNLGQMVMSFSELTGNGAHNQGGGISNSGTLIINNSTISGNSVFYYGGGIYNAGIASLNNSTLNANQALYGGGIYNHSDGAMTITNSTLSGNDGTNDGGGINNQGALTLASSTLSGNTAGFGGGIYGDFALHNTILANNSSSYYGPDCYSMNVSTGGYNLVGNINMQDCHMIFTTGDLTNIDPMLGPLKDNGGSTLTHALFPGSLAINAGDPDGCTDIPANPLPTDQRGLPRAGRCDIGAYEWQPEISGAHTIYLPSLVRSCSALLFSDDFSNPGSGWPIYDDAELGLEYLNNQYRILVKEAGIWVGAWPDFIASDYVAVVDVLNATSVDGSYGVLFGLSDDLSKFYTFEINTKGDYAIWRVGSNDGNITYDWRLLALGYSGSIHPGSGTNQLKVKQNENQIWAYANDQLLNIIEDGDDTGQRSAGLIAVSYDQPGVDVRFDNFTLYPVDCRPSITSLDRVSGNSVAVMESAPLKNWESKPYSRR
jgi:CSLREA domain-containing protein